MSEHPILRTATRLLHPLLIFFALYLLAFGHDAPGGGFPAGLVAAAAFALLAFVDGPAAARRALPLPPRLMTAWGLTLALASGVLALTRGAPYGTALWTEMGGRHLGTPMLFELGVFLVVAGVSLTLVLRLLEA